MKTDVIKAMFADPGCDPTEWFGSALIAYAAKNPVALLRDHCSRKYILQAMESYDVYTISKGVRTLYDEIKDTGLVKEMLSHANQPNLRASDFIGPWQRIFRSDGPKIEEIAKEFCNLKNCDASISDSFSRWLNESDAFKLLENWNSYDWTESSWINVLERIRSEDGLKSILTLLETGNLWKKLDKSRSMYWASDFQNILYFLAIRIPHGMEKRWLDWIESVKITKIWWSDEMKKLCRRQSVEGEEINIDERLCRCGFSAKSNSGYALHQNKCGNIDPNLLTASRIRYATSNPDSLICVNCGRKLKSKPGFALHLKKCKPTTEYSVARREPVE